MCPMDFFGSRVGLLGGTKAPEGPICVLFFNRESSGATSSWRVPKTTAVFFFFLILGPPSERGCSKTNLIFQGGLNMGCVFV